MDWKRHWAEKELRGEYVLPIYKDASQNRLRTGVGDYPKQSQDIVSQRTQDLQ